MWSKGGSSSEFCKPLVLNNKAEGGTEKEINLKAENWTMGNQLGEIAWENWDAGLAWILREVCQAE